MKSFKKYIGHQRSDKSKFNFLCGEKVLTHEEIRAQQLKKMANKYNVNTYDKMHKESFQWGTSGRYIEAIIAKNRAIVHGSIHIDDFFKDRKNT